MLSKELAPLQNTLDLILNRLARLESTVGVQSPADSRIATNALDGNDSVAPAVAAYQTHTSKAVIPFIEACNVLDGFKDIGSNLESIWAAIGTIVELASKCKKPSDVQTALGTYLKPVQNSIGKIRSARLDRKYDWHIKAIMEMLPCASWVMMSAPPAPSNFVKDTIGSSDYWSNKIRKEYKGKDENHITFCVTLKALILNLSTYLKEYHFSGLMWNPRGIPLEQYEPPSVTVSVPSPSPPTSGKSSARPTTGDVMTELASRRTVDGSSAATGLASVSREQQTWRKEYKKQPSTHTTTSTVRPSQVKASQVSIGKKKIERIPTCKFKEPSKWIIEYQTETSNPNGLCKIEAKHPKEQVYIYKCENATIQVKGKVKNITMDSCIKTNLVFDIAISACEIVNCNKVQIQSIGVCPSFAIDKTDGCLLYLSKEATSISNFVTTKSSEMNISWTDGKSGDQKECPIPEQFEHRLVNGAITTKVSNLYH